MEGKSMLTASDIALLNNDGMFGGNGIGMWAFFLFAILFGGNFGGFGNRGNVATTEELSAGFNFAGVNNKLNEITAGIAGVNQNLGNAICSSTYELASKIDNCCCNTQLAIKDLTASVVAENAKTRDLIQENKIESLQAQVNQLQLAQATCGIPKVNPYGYGTYVYPCFANAGCGSCTNNLY